mgnify:CR=1 FL=1
MLGLDIVDDEKEEQMTRQCQGHEDESRFRFGIYLIIVQSYKKYVNKRIKICEVNSILFFPKKVCNGYERHLSGAQAGLEPFGLLWMTVERRDANMATKLPPTPFTTG